MFSILEILRKHKSVRRFKSLEVSGDIKEKLEEIFVLSPTAQCLQACSMIEITDKSKKEELARITGQEYTKDVPLIYIFIIDMQKHMKLKNEYNQKLGMNHISQGIVDAIIASQSMFLEAENLGLSGYYFSSLLRDTNKVCEILKLPKYTYPVVGLALGYADENPTTKPRMDKKYRVFKDEYKEYDDYEKELEEYDDIFKEYIDLRNKDKKIGKFTDYVKNNFNTKIKNIEDFEKQGFGI